MSEKITIIILNHNGVHLLPDALDAIRRLEYPEYQVMVVDNASTDGSVELVQKNYPECRVVQLPTNTGVNGARNAGIKNADTPLVFIMDNDVILTPHCLSILARAYHQVPDTAIVSPRTFYQQEPDTVQYDGTLIHYICAAIHPNAGKRFPNPSGEYPDVPQPKIIDKIGCGGMILVHRESAQKLGLFDEDFFFGWTDGEFIHRALIAGYHSIHVPDAVIFHKKKPRGSKGTSQAQYQIRNRWYFIIKNYAARTLILTAPALLLYELTLMVFALLKGIFPQYVKGNLEVIKNFRSLMKKRAIIQGSRKVQDSELLTSGPVTVSEQMVDNKILQLGTVLMSGVFNLYWKIVYRLI